MSFPSATVTATSTPISSIPSSKRPPVNLNPSLSSHSSFTSTSSASPTPIGVVVVGFIGTRSCTDLTHLINRLLDDNIFGSCNRDKDLPAYTILDEMARGENNGGNVRRITYYHEPEKGMIYLHYSASSPLRSFLLSSSILEDSEADDLRSMLLMFSVCHVIVFVHEGLQFNTQILQKFRILQAAKQALSRFVRSQIPPLASSKQSLPISKNNVLRASSISPPTRKGGSSNRHGPAISLMSGNGSHPSMLPGLCIPVLIFVFEDDFIDSSSPRTNVDDTTEAYKHNSTLKGSGSVVMLARPASKAEGSFKRRLQSSLEAQIRFLIKKCRILTGTDHIQSGSRGAGTANSLPLFLLDASRVVSLLDRSSNQRGEPLSFITRLLDEEDKVDVSIIESHCVNLHNEDVQSLKDFILRQADMLRGRGGLASNVNSGSVAGVGVLAAAAAAAASVAAGKLVNTPELPSLENWLLATNQIHVALVSVGHGLENIIKSASSTGTPDVQAVEDAISCLESGNGQNMKFSISWCQRVLPVAKEVYLKDLPARYPTSIHKKQLENALVAFHSMVKGPAVKMFADKLADQCISIWEAGRQLCDAISITGKPCMHLRHDITRSDPCKEDAILQHSSGFVFLHACACGRSRRLRDDPFDFENANITFNHFPNCENHLPRLFLSNLTIGGPLPPAAWSLVRVGGAGYYEHSKGLLQTGFCFSQNFLLKWTISTDKETETSNLPLGVLENVSAGSLISDPKTMPELAEGKVKPSKTKLNSEVQLIFESQKEISDPVPSSAPFISFGRGLPSFTMKKPFAEVVAGMATTDLRKHKKDITAKVIYQSDLSSQSDARSKPIDDHSASQGIELVSTQENAIKTEANCQINANPYLQIGTNIVPVEMFSSTEKKTVAMSKQSSIYVGFEHECSYGHRFLLSLEHFKNLDSSCSLTSKAQFSTNESEAKYAENKNGIPEMNDHYSSRKATGMTSMTYDNKLNGFAAANSGLFHGNFTTLLKDGNEKIQSPHEISMSSDNVHQLEGNLSQVRLDDGSSAYSLLSRNVPVYMNCPHCSKSAKQSHQKVKFASKVSQLQRIFLVTPPFPTVLATCPVIQFEESCLPPSTLDLKQQSRFSLGCHVVLPPESFLTLRLPFIYGVLMGDKSLQPLRHIDDKPELTAWLVKGTTLQVVSMGHENIEASQIP